MDPSPRAAGRSPPPRRSRRARRRSKRSEVVLMNQIVRTRILPAAIAALAAVLAPAALLAGGAKITIVNGNAPGVGFNDTTPAAPVGGNTGTTIGAQRLIAFQRAADIWGSLLDSAVEIRIQATFSALSCDATSAVLGSAGPSQVISDFPGARVSGTLYPSALASKQAGTRDSRLGAND